MRAAMIRLTLNRQIVRGAGLCLLLALGACGSGSTDEAPSTPIAGAGSGGTSSGRTGTGGVDSGGTGGVGAGGAGTGGQGTGGEAGSPGGGGTGGSGKVYDDVVFQETFGENRAVDTWTIIDGDGLEPWEITNSWYSRSRRFAATVNGNGSDDPAADDWLISPVIETGVVPIEISAWVRASTSTREIDLEVLLAPATADGSVPAVDDFVSVGRLWSMVDEYEERTVEATAPAERFHVAFYYGGEPRESSRQHLDDVEVRRQAN